MTQANTDDLLAGFRQSLAESAKSDPPQSTSALPAQQVNGSTVGKSGLTKSDIADVFLNIVSPITLFSRPRSVAKSGIQSIVGLTGSVVSGLGEPIEFIGLGEGDNFRNAGQAVHNFAVETFPAREDLVGSFWWDTIPQGLGSFAGFALVGVAGTAVGGPAGGFAAVAAVGGLSSAAEQRSRVQPFVDDGTLSERDALRASMLGILPGLAEAITPLRFLKVVGGRDLQRVAARKLGEVIKRHALKTITKESAFEALTETVQETLGTIAQNVIEAKFTGDGKKFYADIFEAGAAGGVTGAIAGAVAAAIGLKTRGRFRSGATTKELGAQVLVAQALNVGLVRQDELTAVEGDIGLLFRLAEARFSNREAEIVDRTDKEGNVTKVVRSRPDNVLWTERVALKHNPNLIKGLQAGRKKKGITLEDLFRRNAEGEPEFIFPFSRDSGFLQNPEKLTDDLRARQAIARIQSALLPNMRTIRGLKELSAGEQSVLLMRLDAEHAARIARVLRNDDNDGKSVGKEILREISEEVEPDDQTRVADILLASLESTIKGKPLSKQRDIIEGLIDTVSDPRARAVLQSLHRKMLTDFRRRPWSERVGMGRNKLNNLREAMRKKPQFVVDLLKRQKEMRANLVELAKSLPPEHRGNLLKIISKVTTAREFGEAVDAIAKAQVIYQRAVHTNSIVKSAKRIEKNPRKAEAIALLRAGLDVRERDVVGARRRGTSPDVKAVRTDDGFDIIKGNTKLGQVKEIKPGVWTARTVGGIISESHKSQRDAIDSILLPYMTVFHGGKLEGGGRAGPLLFVGTEKAARRAKGIKGKILKGRIKLDNPIRMIDSGRVHTPTVIAEDIVAAGNDIPYLVDAIRSIENLHGVDVAGHALIVALQRQKYDGIIFTNINEDPGSESFVLFNNSKVMRDLHSDTVGAKTRQVVKAYVDDLGFYSQLEKTILDKVSGPITFKQLMATLKKSGVKDAEIAWVGLEDVFSQDVLVVEATEKEIQRLKAGEKVERKIFKRDILAHIQANRLLLMETVRVKTPDKSDKTVQERTRILLETSVREKSIIFNIVSRMDSLSTIRPNTFDVLADTIRLQMVTSRSAGQTFLEAITDVVTPGAATNVFIARILGIEVNSLVATDILIRMDSELRSSVELSELFEDNEQTNLTPLEAATEAVDRGTLEGFRIIKSLFTDLPSGELHEPSVHNLIHDLFLGSAQNEFRDYRAAVRATMIEIRGQVGSFLHEIGLESSEMQSLIREKLFASDELKVWYERQQRFTREFDVARDESSNIEPLFANYTLPGGTNYQEVILRFPDNVEQGIDTILSVPLGGGHFPENNVLAHIRMKDRVTEDGKKILFIEEIQSDLMQGIADRARSLVRRVAEGSPTESVSIGGREVPIPFVRNWHELVLRRVLRIAVEGGYDGVSWTTGREQTSRYGGAGEQGLNTFYDEVIPNYMRRLGKRFGAALDVLQVELGVPGVFHLQSGILITDSMRETLTSEGQKLFQRRRETLPTPAVAPVDGPSLTGPALIFDPDTGELVEANVRHRGEVTVDPDEALDRPLTDHEKEKVEIALKSSRFSAISPVHTDINKMWEKAVKEGSLTSRGLTILRFLFADSGPEVMGRLGDLISTGELVETTGKIETVPDRPIILLTTKRPSDATLDTLGFHTFLHEFGHLAYFAYLNESDIAGLKDDHSILLNTPSTKGHKSLAHEIIAEGTLEEATRRGRVLNAISESDVDYYASNPQEFFAQVFVQHILGNRIPLRALNSLTSRGVISRLINSLYWAMKRLIRIAKFTDSKIPKGTIAAIEKVFAGTEKSEGLSPERRKSEEFQRSVLIAVSSVERGEGGTRRRDLTEEEMVELLRAGGKFTKIDDDVIGAKRRETPPPPVVQRDSTGKDTVSIKNLKKRLQDLDPDEIKNLDNNLRRVVRQGMIEKGLFRKSLKFQSEQDVADALQFLVDKDVKSDWWRKTDTFRSLSRLALDPVTVEGWLLQISKSDENGFMYEVFFKNFKKPYEQTQRNNAETRRTIDRAAEKHLGIKSKLKFVRYLNKKLKNGMLRSEAMWAYALDRDAGRSEAVRKDGIRARDNRYDIDEAIGLLSSADKAFVDSTAKYFQNNDFIERAFRNHLLLNGYEAERSPDRWFTSRRNIEPSRLAKGIDDFAVQVITETDALKARTENVGVPFQLDGGYVAAFYHVSDRLSIFAEMGMNMHRAEKLINDPKFTEDFRRRYGNRQLQTIQLYLRNILGMVGHNPSAMDVAFTYFPQAWLASKISGNVTSAIRQTFSLMTALGDDILDTSAILRSIGEQSGFNRKVGRRMRANSGFAFMRLNTGRFAEHLMVLGEQKAGTTFAWAQDQAFFLQRIMDDFALRITYRAAEIMAKKRGLTGEAAEDFVREKFETALMRNQASNSPLYASGLELEAKRHPMWRGTLALQRELNRLYNVPRRHVVRAMQEPTPKNIKQAMLSIFWSGIANTSASVGLNAIRHSIAFGLPAWGASELFKKYLQDLAGRWYLIGDVTSAFLEYGGRGESYAAERLLPPGPATLVDGIQMGWGVLKIAELSGLDTTDPDRYIKSGPRVGQTKMQVQMERTFKKGLSFGSAIFGMPFAALWYQASGMYNWQRNDYRLMVHLEAEWAQLRKDEVEDTSTRGREIKRLRKAVNRIHSRRIKGFLTKEEARSMIIEKLELDQLVRTPVE